MTSEVAGSPAADPDLRLPLSGWSTLSPSDRPDKGSSPRARPNPCSAEATAKAANSRTSTPDPRPPCRSENAPRTADTCWCPRQRSRRTAATESPAGGSQCSHLAAIVVATGADPDMQAQPDALGQAERTILFLRHEFGRLSATQHLKPPLRQTISFQDRCARPDAPDAAPPSNWTN